MGGLKIFVATHKPVYVPKNKYLLPVQAGTALAGQRFAGMLHDDEGENISGKNKSYCELTVQYWAWKNQDADFYGFFHYRRYMGFAKEYPIGKDGKPPVRQWRPYREQGSIRGDLSALRLEEANIRKVVEKYDMVTVLSERMDVTAYQQFCQFHGKEEIDTVIQILKKRYPAYARACDAYMESKDIYFCNMYIMKRGLFFRYMEWLFQILEEFEKARPLAGQGGKRQRMAGYLAERLFGVYYTQLKMQGRARCCELQYVIFHDGNTGNVRKFPVGKRGWTLPVDMAAVNRAFPPGTRRRRLLRAFYGRHQGLSGQTRRPAKAGIAFPAKAGIASSAKAGIASPAKSGIAFPALGRPQDSFHKYRQVESELLWQGALTKKHVDVTVLIITYKRPALFYEAFQSVCAQREAGLEWEILVMDNHPQETEVGAIIARENNQRVRYYRNKENIGHEGNMNRGIELARGGWVALLHDDDLLVENYLVLLKKYLRACSRFKKPVAYIHANYQCFTSGRQVRGYVCSDRIENSKYIRPELWLETLLRGCGPTYVNSCGSAVNRRAFLQIGGYRSAFYPIGDATLGLLLMERGYAVYTTERILGFYRQGANESIQKETVLRLLQADFALRNALYQRNAATRMFGALFRDAQYQAAVDAKLDMARRYQKNSGGIPSFEEINRIYPYKKCRITGTALKIMRLTLDLLYRRGSIIRKRLCQRRKFASKADGCPARE